MISASVQDHLAAAGIGERPGGQFARTIAAALVGAGILLAAWLARSKVAPTLLAHPAWLLPAGLWLLVPHRSAALRRMQDLVFLYISLALVTEAARLSWEIGSFRVSASVGCVALAGAGWVMQLLRGGRLDANRPVPPDGALTVAVGVLMVHALALGIVLRCWYGYGYEAGFAVAGRIALCIVWLGVATPLARARRARAVVVAGICLLWVLS